MKSLTIVVLSNHYCSLTYIYIYRHVKINNYSWVTLGIPYYVSKLGALHQIMGDNIQDKE